MIEDSTGQQLDDTSGHVLHGDAAQDPVSGGKAPSAVHRAVAGEDDAEGHLRSPSADGAQGQRDDVVEGHRRAAVATGEPEQDDAEGHRFIARSADEPDDDTEGHLRRL